jgi:hypothetical protein
MDIVNYIDDTLQQIRQIKKINNTREEIIKLKKLSVQLYNVTKMLYDHIDTQFGKLECEKF